MKRVKCNDCGKAGLSAVKDTQRIKCGYCGSNQSLSIREAPNGEDNLWVR